MTSKRATQSGILLCLLAFVTLFGYAIARPATESLFLEDHGADALPWAWLAIAVASAGVVVAFNQAAARMPLGRVMLGAVGTSAASLVVLMGMAQAAVPGSTLLLYVWKDVHIVVLLELLWSFANLVFEKHTARWFNVVFCACGSLGGLAGNLAVGVLAARWGTALAPLFVLPFFGVQAALAVGLARAAGHPAPKDRKRIGLGDAAELLRRSPYVGWLVLLIGTVQLTINLIDYVYQDAIARAYVDVDARTAVIGQVYGAIDIASLSMQLASGFVIGALGVRRTLLAVPSLLGLSALAFIAAPRFALMAITKVASKAFDYSLFRAAKEMLYLPLSYRDKTRGKALVDMLTYRVAKGGASVVILGLGAAAASFGVIYATVACIALWLGLTYAVATRYQRLTRQDE